MTKSSSEKRVSRLICQRFRVRRRQSGTARRLLFPSSRRRVAKCDESLATLYQRSCQTDHPRRWNPPQSRTSDGFEPLKPSIGLQSANRLPHVTTSKCRHQAWIQRDNKSRTTQLDRAAPCTCAESRTGRRPRAHGVGGPHARKWDPDVTQTPTAFDVVAATTKKKQQLYSESEFGGLEVNQWQENRGSARGKIWMLADSG